MTDRVDADRTLRDDVDHLARSPHRTRVAVLFLGDDWTRRDLHEETGIPQPTLGRILGSFQDRDWIERQGETYGLTLNGRLVLSRFVDLLDVIETVQDLPNSANFESLIELGFDVDWFADVEVRAPSGGGDPFSHLREAQDIAATASQIREVSPGPMPGMFETMRPRIERGDLSVETVFATGGVEALVAEPETRSIVAKLLDAGHFELYRYDDRVPGYVGRKDDRVVMALNSAEGPQVAMLTSTDRRVREWADAVVDDFQARADPVIADDLLE